MKRVLLIIKKLLIIFWWQDIEKSNIFVRILNYIFAFTLSFGAFSWTYLSNMNLILKIIVGIYGVLTFMSFWPASNLLDEESEAKGSIFYIFQNTLIIFSFIILLRYIIKEEKY
ncbi:hypothetical protein FDC58_06555 [Clostridium botulinum]|uniref:hypothetical protein n=1 Tax=unclassified Clostridium TaxID=2614128 RepID=UPI0005057153|nr:MULTISPECIES: hypothetical protein [unclassified Clostridium]AIY79843.1 putative membrane protein [Clostridium botulinum 202F]KAI3346005.1 hypothetical protein CIT17_10500 [Clostridium botulinum]KFX55397.1 hypothetical protein KU40_09330 [Clostridium botulinum]KFX55949.1 hypothetical protein KU41_16175 [Clostridium botulinum]KON13429.1 hypothetical protein ACP50_04985 [Clostridium botulinum]